MNDGRRLGNFLQTHLNFFGSLITKLGICRGAWKSFFGWGTTEEDTRRKKSMNSPGGMKILRHCVRFLWMGVFFVSSEDLECYGGIIGKVLSVVYWTGTKEIVSSGGASCRLPPKHLSFILLLIASSL